MTLPASGSITIAQIATELGVALPLDINAANVRTLAGKPTGNVIMPTDFYGKTAADYVPDAMAWGDITAVDDATGGGSSTYAENTNQTLAGINVAITLEISVPSFEVNCSGNLPNVYGYLDIIKNNIVVGTLSKSRFSAGSTSSAASTTVSVSSGDTLKFATYCSVGGSTGGSSGGGGGTVSVINQSSSNTVLDTFTFSMSATNDGSGGAP